MAGEISATSMRFHGIGGDGPERGPGAQADHQGAVEGSHEERGEVGEAPLRGHLGRRRRPGTCRWCTRCGRRRRATVVTPPCTSSRTISMASGGGAGGEVDVCPAREPGHVPARQEHRDQRRHPAGPRPPPPRGGRAPRRRGERERHRDGPERALRAQRGQEGVAREDRAGDGARGVGDGEPPDARGDVEARGHAVQEQGKVDPIHSVGRPGSPRGQRPTPRAPAHEHVLARRR